MELYSPGPLPVIARMAREIRLVETINRVVEYDETQCKLLPGERVLAMVMNLLTDRHALYQMPDFFRGTDIENLFSSWRDDEGIVPEDVNDDTLGRGLDKVHEANGLEVASSVILEALNREDVSMGSFTPTRPASVSRGSMRETRTHWTLPTDTARTTART
jgi:hypothetical protein